MQRKKYHSNESYAVETLEMYLEKSLESKVKKRVHEQATVDMHIHNIIYLVGSRKTDLFI